jgi:pimeloyl-ACP methyl ester carboxylesterase
MSTIQKNLPITSDKGTGTPLVLLHGLGNNHTSWQFVLKYIDYTKFRVITLDLLGFGDAPKPNNSNYTPKDHAKAVLATLDALGIEQAVFAGHSMGCIVAIEIAHTWPKRAISLLLLGAPLYKATPTHSWRHKWFRAEGLYFSLFEVIQRHPEAIKTGSDLANELLPFVKGMDITDETWPAFTKSLEHTIMQQQSFTKAVQLHTPSIFVNGLLDIFIIRRNIRIICRGNRTYTRLHHTLGPHELTPRQGRTIGNIINRLKI